MAKEKSILESEHIDITLASVDNDGIRVEFAINGNISFPFAWVREDEETGVRLVIATDIGDISVPLEEFERVIEIAKKEVHSESFYDQPKKDV